MKRLVAISVAAAALVTGMAFAQGGLLDEIKSRGTLVCGVNNQVPGFGNVEADGSFTGFDVDFCRAIAAAVLGDADAVDFRPVTAQERPIALQTGEVDVLIRNTTWACLMFCVCRVVVKGLAPCLTQTLNRSLKRLMISLKNPLSRRFQLRNWQRPELWMACSNRLTGANFN